MFDRTFYRPATKVETAETSHFINLPTNAPTTSVFVGDLASFTTEKDLFDLFSVFGSIVSVEIKRGRHGDSLLHGFVEFSSLSSAQYAISASHDRKFKGRKMKVNWTNIKVPQTKNVEKWALIQVTFKTDNPQMRVSEEFLDALFARFGHVEDVIVKRHIVSHNPTGVHGHANVYFAEIMAAMSAMVSLRDTSFQGVSFECSLTMPKANSDAGNSSDEPHLTPSSMLYGGASLTANKPHTSRGKTTKESKARIQGIDNHGLGLQSAAIPMHYPGDQVNRQQPQPSSRFSLQGMQQQQHQSTPPSPSLMYGSPLPTADTRSFFAPHPTTTTHPMSAKHHHQQQQSPPLPAVKSTGYPSLTGGIMHLQESRSSIASSASSMSRPPLPNRPVFSHGLATAASAVNEDPSYHHHPNHHQMSVPSRSGTNNNNTSTMRGNPQFHIDCQPLLPPPPPGSSSSTYSSSYSTNTSTSPLSSSSSTSSSTASTVVSLTHMNHPHCPHHSHYPHPHYPHHSHYHPSHVGTNEAATSTTASSSSYPMTMNMNMNMMLSTSLSHSLSASNDDFSSALDASSASLDDRASLSSDYAASSSVRYSNEWPGITTSTTSTSSTNGWKMTKESSGGSSSYVSSSLCPSPSPFTPRDPTTTTTRLNLWTTASSSMNSSSIVNTSAGQVTSSMHPVTSVAAAVAAEEEEETSVFFPEEEGAWKDCCAMKKGLVVDRRLFDLSPSPESSFSFLGLDI